MQEQEQKVRIKKRSSFKDHGQAENFYDNWIREISKQSNTSYRRKDIATSLGNTVVHIINEGDYKLEPLVIFPGFRTSSMFWDLDDGLAPLKKHCRIYLVETNGQPVLSDGNSPSIRSVEYGHWAAEVINGLGLDKTNVAGASFGGLVCLKLSIVAPHLVSRIFLLNPGCLQPFSMSWKNLYYNMLPLIACSERNVATFLDNAIFYKESHRPSPETRRLVIDFEVFVINNYRDKTEKPYAMTPAELALVKNDVYLLLGDKDMLFPTKRSVQVAEKNLGSMKEIHVFPGVGHGIEIYPEAMQKISDIINTTGIR